MRFVMIALFLMGVLSAEPRKALLIGNSEYSHIPNLKNPSSGMALLQEALEGLGFDVKVKYNLNAENLSAEVEKFADRLSPTSTGFFYYSGHGSQLKGVSYLIPTNVDTKKPNKVRYYALSIDEVLSSLQRAKNRVNMLFFDACRDVPTGTKGGTKGLGNPSNKPNGSLIVYATEAGKVAQDNTIFISELTKAIQQPNREILQIGNSLSNSVAIRTDNAQVPEMYSKRLPSGFVLNIQKITLEDNDEDNNVIIIFVIIVLFGVIVKYFEYVFYGLVGALIFGLIGSFFGDVGIFIGALLGFVAGVQNQMDEKKKKKQ